MYKYTESPTPIEKRTPIATPTPIEAALMLSSFDPTSAVGVIVSVGAGVVVGTELGTRLGNGVGRGLGYPVDIPEEDTRTDATSRKRDVAAVSYVIFVRLML
jgi:hypothetical protein